MQTDQFLNCPICLEIAQDAVESQCCHNIFCLACSAPFEAKKCPVCVSETVKFQPNILARRMVSSTNYTCPDCQVVTTLGDYSNHMELCAKKLRVCSIGNCIFEGTGQDFFTHLYENHRREIFRAYDKNTKKNIEEKVEKPKGNVNTGSEQIVPIDPLKFTVNGTGRKVKIGELGKYYCGGKQLQACNCCDGYCGPTNGCNCKECMILDIKARGLSKGYLVNSEGAICKNVGGVFYCGRYKQIPRSDGYCGPNNGPSCIACQKIAAQVRFRYTGLV